jgi:hypothetical protein
VVARARAGLAARLSAVSTRQAVAFAFLDRYAGLVAHTISSMVLARLLTPGEIGVYSVVMLLIGFVAVFRDFGAGQYLVQQRELSPTVMRVTWTLQLGWGTLFAAATFASAHPVAAFYADQRIVAIMQVLALNFLVTPLAAFPYALLVRDMRFGTIAMIRFSGALVHALTAVAAAWSGYGAISLAWANLAATLANIAVTYALTRLPMWQSLTLRGLAESMKFGGVLTSVQLIGHVRASLPELLLGKLHSLTAAGLMSRAQGLVAMFWCSTRWARWPCPTSLANCAKGEISRPGSCAWSTSSSAWAGRSSRCWRSWPSRSSGCSTARNGARRWSRRDGSQQPPCSGCRGPSVIRRWWRWARCARCSSPPR